MNEAAQNDKSQLEPVRATRKPRKQAKAKPVPKKPPRANPAPRPAGLMRISAPPERSWSLAPEEVTIIKNHVAKGATDEELKFCLAVARRRKLDPFKSQIWFVKRKDKTAEGGVRWIPMTSIDGLLHLAARDHKDFGSSDEPTYGPMKEVKWSYYDKSGKIMAPEWASVAVWKKGATRPTVCTVYWEEVYPDIGSSPMVREKPRLMLGKCALAQAVRRAYPDTGGLYISEEFQGPKEFTESGREITITPAVPAAEQAYLDREKEQMGMLTEPQREVVQRRMAEAEAKKNPVSQPAMPAPAAKEASAAKPAVVPESAAGSAPQVSPRSSAKGASSAAEPGNSAATAPYDGLTFSLRPDGDWEVEGLVSVKRGVRDLLLPFYDKPKDKIICSNTEAGKLMHQLEVRGVKARMIGDGENS